jgi:PPK2 family polyphosphate:nucleotide phosphotransferase
MKKQELARVEEFLDPYRVTRGKGFRLKDFDPADTGPFARDAGDEASDKSRAKRMLADSVKWLAEQQDVLYAQDRWSVLLVFQAMDAAGKDGTIKHVASGLNPQGVNVTSFKQPSAEELDHDWMWRSWRALPPRGHIGIFNRSYYEEVLVVKVHPELLAHQKLPPERVGKKVWQHRYRDIRSFERYLADNGTIVLKFFLNVSKAEQKRRFMSRLDEPEKNWKFSASDV